MRKGVNIQWYKLFIVIYKRLFPQLFTEKYLELLSSIYSISMRFYDLFSALLGVQQSTPIGNYCGSQSVFGYSLEGFVQFKTPQLLDLSITGDFNINCPNEPYYFDGNYIILQNLYSDGDCIHDNLNDNNIIISSILFDDTNNQIDLSVKYSIAKFDLSLTSCNHFYII